MLVRKVRSYLTAMTLHVEALLSIDRDWLAVNHQQGQWHALMSPR